MRRLAISCAATLALGTCLLAVGGTSATFQATSANPGNSISLDASFGGVFALLDVTPGTATQYGTSNPVATGSDGTLAMDLGRNPSSRTITNAVRIANQDTVPHVVTLSAAGPLASISEIRFETADSATTTLAAGASQTVKIVTTSAAAGAHSGSLRVQVDASETLTSEVPLQNKQAPGQVAVFSATADTDSINLGWTAPSSTGIGGYNITRATASGGPYTKINSSGIQGTSYDDATTVVGSRYWYIIRAFADGVSPELEASSAPIRNSRIPSLPTSATVQVTSNNNLDWIALANRSAVTVRVSMPASTEATDTVRVTLTDSAGNPMIASKALSAAGAQNVDVSGINASSLLDGNITLKVETLQGTLGPAYEKTVGKDTVVPPAATGGSIPAVTNVNPLNVINKNIESSVPALITLPSTMPAGKVTVRFLIGGSGGGSSASWSGGSGSLTVNTNQSALANNTNVTLQAQTVDLAGNPGPYMTRTVVKDTYAPVPGWSYISFNNQPLPTTRDTVTGNGGAVSGGYPGGLIRVTDGADGVTRDLSGPDSNGAFGSWSVSVGNVPRTLYWAFRDANLNWSLQYSVTYTTGANNDTGGDPTQGTVCTICIGTGG